MYNYLVVGSGLYGAIFAHEAKKAGKSVLVIDKRPNIAGIFIQRKLKELMYISMVHIFSIQITREYGNTLRSLRNSTDLRIVLLLIIRVNYIAFLLICILSIRCGEL